MGPLLNESYLSDLSVTEIIAKILSTAEGNSFFSLKN